MKTKHEVMESTEGNLGRNCWAILSIVKNRRLN
jgi:hypothetical protein